MEACLLVKLVRRGAGLQVELPLGATEDRICGTIDIEKALQEGVKAYEPGLLVRCIFETMCTCSKQISGFTGSRVQGNKYVTRSAGSARDMQ